MGAVRILVVAGEAETARVLARLLTELGHAVAVVGGVRSAVAAVAAVPTGSFDAVITELDLPDGTGEALMRRIRPVRVIAVATGGEGQAVDAGFVAVLTKPWDAGRLAAAIASSMAR